ncbi:MAG: ATP-binding cassette domain-containing protein [Wenzhouxiangellaceae bacterium]|nr:ATP-binding cassette domain-containing protein [Wenzhouxiangellaceae bacterium]
MQIASLIHPDRPAIRLEHVRMVRSGTLVLDDFNLEVPAGKVTAIMGPSGSGKTTVLKLITGQLLPDAGRVFIGDTEITSLTRPELNRLRRNVGVLLQNGALLTDLTCFDNVALPLREHTALPETVIRKLVLLKLQAVGLRGAAAFYPSQLSGGMARRVATARALALDPDLMLYDEPFAGLDPISLAAGGRLIKQINRVVGITSLVITHDVAEVSKFADYACIMAQGKVVACGIPEQLHGQDNEVIRQFLEGLPDGPVPFHYPAPDLAADFLGEGCAT